MLGRGQPERDLDLLLVNVRAKAFKALLDKWMQIQVCEMEF
jgi:hypothetical protein